MLLIMVGVCGLVLTSTVQPESQASPPQTPPSNPPSENPPIEPPPTEIPPEEQVKIFVGVSTDWGYFQTTVKIDGVSYQTCVNASEYIVVRKGERKFEFPLRLTVVYPKIDSPNWQRPDPYYNVSVTATLKEFKYYPPPDHVTCYNYFEGSGGWTRDEVNNTGYMTLDVEQGYNFGAWYSSVNPFSLFSLYSINIPWLGGQQVQIDILWLLFVVAGIGVAIFSARESS